MGTDIQIARIMGIPIRLHWSLLVFFPLIAMYFAAGMTSLQNPWLWGLLLTGLLFISVVLHELGHALVGLALGAHTRDILLLPIGGSARMENMPRRPWQELLLALAGPLVSLMLAMSGWLAAGIFYHSLGLQNAGQILATAAWINFWLALFNLLPSFPMDGGRILRALLTPWFGRLRATRFAARLGQALAVFFGVLGAFPPFNWPLVAIAIFLFATAGAEYRMVVREEDEIRQANREAALRENMALVGPSPFQPDAEQTMVALQTFYRRRANDATAEPDLH